MFSGIALLRNVFFATLLPALLLGIASISEGQSKDEDSQDKNTNMPESLQQSLTSNQNTTASYILILGDGPDSLKYLPPNTIQYFVKKKRSQTKLEKSRNKKHQALIWNGVTLWRHNEDSSSYEEEALSVESYPRLLATLDPNLMSSMQLLIADGYSNDILDAPKLLKIMMWINYFHPISLGQLSTRICINGNGINSELLALLGGTRIENLLSALDIGYFVGPNVTGKSPIVKNDFVRLASASILEPKGPIRYIRKSPSAPNQDQEVAPTGTTPLSNQQLDIDTHRSRPVSAMEREKLKVIFEEFNWLKTTERSNSLDDGILGNYIVIKRTETPVDQLKCFEIISHKSPSSETLFEVELSEKDKTTRKIDLALYYNHIGQRGSSKYIGQFTTSNSHVQWLIVKNNSGRLTKINIQDLAVGESYFYFEKLYVTLKANALLDSIHDQMIKTAINLRLKQVNFWNQLTEDYQKALTNSEEDFESRVAIKNLKISYDEYLKNLRSAEPTERHNPPEKPSSDLTYAKEQRQCELSFSEWLKFQDTKEKLSLKISTENVDEVDQFILEATSLMQKIARSFGKRLRNEIE